MLCSPLVYAVIWPAAHCWTMPASSYLWTSLRSRLPQTSSDLWPPALWQYDSVFSDLHGDCVLMSAGHLLDLETLFLPRVVVSFQCHQYDHQCHHCQPNHQFNESVCQVDTTSLSCRRGMLTWSLHPCPALDIPTTPMKFLISWIVSAWVTSLRANICDKSINCYRMIKFKLGLGLIWEGTTTPHPLLIML